MDSISARSHNALVKLAGPPSLGQGVMSRRMANALKRAGYIEVVSYILGNRMATRLTAEGRAYLEMPDLEPPPLTDLQKLSDKVVAARLRLRVARDAGIGGIGRGDGVEISEHVLREALHLVDALAEVCLALLPEEDE